MTGHEVPRSVDDLPEAVRSITDFLDERGVWHVLSRNPVATSCRDAADKRWRLGDRGIPLCDELKSSVLTVDGERCVAIHCRGHQQLAEAKVERLVGGKVRRLDETALFARFKMQYGTVTPFGFAQYEGVEQVFDRTLLEPFFPPYTMMTNCGDHTFAVEFEPAQLFAALDGVVVDDVIADGDGQAPVNHTIGILTGNGPDSGMLLWDSINNHIRARGTRSFRGDVAFPRVVIESVPGMGLSMDLSSRADEVRPVVLSAVQRLCDTGATLIGIACNTTQYFAEDVRAICDRNGAVFVAIAEETARYLNAQGIERFDFFGISAVNDFDGWSAFGMLDNDFELIRPHEDDIARIDKAAYDIKQRGVDARAVNHLRDLVSRASHTDTIVVALTELSVVLSSQRRRGDKRIVDTLGILAEGIAEIVLRERQVVETSTSRP